MALARLRSRCGCEERVRRERRRLPEDGFDPFGPERLEHAVAQRDRREPDAGALGVEAHPVLVEHVGAIGRHDRRLDSREPRQPVAEPPRVPLAPRGRVGEPLELGARECRGQLAGEIHPAAQRRLRLRLVVERVARVPLRRRLQAVEPDARRAGVEVLGARHEEPALPRRQVLGRVQAEGCHRPQRPDRASFIERAMGLGGVFDHREPSSLGERVDRVHVSGEPVQVDRDDRPGARRHTPRGVGPIEVVGDGVDVGEHRGRPLVQDGLGSRDERERRDDDFVPCPDARRREGDVERRGPAVRGETEARADRRRELGLEPPHLGGACAGEYTAIEHAGHGGAVFVSYDRPALGGHRACRPPLSMTSKSSFGMRSDDTDGTRGI